MKLSASAICVWAFSALSLWQQVSAEHLSYNTRERRQAINKGNVALLARATQAASNVTINSPSGKSYNVISDGNVGTNLYATAAVEMSSYLTYTVFTNATDSSGQWLFEDAKNMCLDFCERTAGCVTANLYRESNNPLLDWVFMEKSNTKCALFSSVPTLSQILNKGQQQQKPNAPLLTAITRSSVWSLSSRVVSDAAVSVCQSSELNRGFNWQYLDRSGIVPDNACSWEEDIFTLNKTDAPSAKGSGFMFTNDIGASAQSFTPCGAKQPLSAKSFTMLYTFYFYAPAKGDYQFLLDNADDVARGWVGENAKTTWQNSTADITSRCASTQRVYGVYRPLERGSYTPVRLAWTQGAGAGKFNFRVLDSQGNDLTSSNVVRDSCDQTPAQEF